nr:glycosyl hydrolase [Saprospiraceae bacterium]
MYKIFLSLCCSCFYILLQAQPIASSTFDHLPFRFIGPEGNRAIAIAGVPGDPMINYIGAASGGLWKTTDGGLNWKPIFDKQTASSVGSVAIAPSNPNQVWVGTGETFVIRPAHAMGDGIYKSTDAGKNWKKMGLEKSGRIGRVIVHPHNQDIVYAAALGHTYGPQKERGVYRSKDGGASWEQVLFVDEGTGAADLAIDPENPDILY